MLEVKSLAVKYGAIQALHDVSISVNRGEIVTLIGSNGAGKSTTLRTISGLLRPASGSILYEGKDISRIAPHEIVKLGLAQSPEGRGVFPQMTVDENLSLGAYTRRDHSEIAKDREKSLDLFPRLRERINQMAGTLSGGEQQMLSMGRGLVSRPRILLLDEPSLGLAPVLVLEIFRVIKQIHDEQKVTILLVEQNARKALGIADYGYILETGKIALHDAAESLRTNEHVRAAYLGGGQLQRG